MADANDAATKGGAVEAHGANGSMNGAVNGAVNGKAKLSAQHLEDLRKSGLNDETISANRLKSFSEPDDITKALNWQSGGSRLGSCLVFPYHGPDGKPTGFGRLRPDKPRCDKKGKPTKYETPKDAINRLYFPVGIGPVLSDPTIPLGIVEGEKKSLAATQFGFPFIATAGVWSFLTKGGGYKKGKSKGSKLLNCFSQVEWKGRAVHICYDSDAATNFNVAAAECSLANHLQRLGAVVKIVRLPPGPPDEKGQPGKVGLDDFLLANGPDKFRELLAAAVDPVKLESKVKTDKPIEAADDPHRLARLFLKGKWIKFWREDFLEYPEACWQPVPTPEIRAKLNACIKAEFDRINLDSLIVWKRKIEDGAADPSKPPITLPVTGKLTSDVLRAVESLTLLPGSIEPPAWIGCSPPPFPACETILTRNAIVHMPSLLAGNPNHFIEPTPDYFALNRLDFDFDLNQPEPKHWLRFVSDLWEGDQQAVDTLQEIMGYLLLPDTSQHKIFLFVGPPRSGKGTIARVMQQLLGRANVASPTLGSLGQGFGLWPLVGKLLAIVSDARLSQRSDSAVVTERLLSISGEDSLTIDRKYREPITAKLNTRFVILTNELPKIGDSSGALASRMLLLKFTKSWLGKEDTELTNRLLTELPAILLWAAVGWNRLRQRGHFVQPESGKELLADLEELSSPIKEFVGECCTVEPMQQVMRGELFECWQAWCEEEKLPCGNSAVFGRDLRAALPAVRDLCPKKTGAPRRRLYQGVGISQEGACVLNEWRRMKLMASMR